MELDLYGRVVVLTGCDAFTRSHLASEGIELAAEEPPPSDPYEAKFRVLDLFSYAFCRCNRLNLEK